MSLIIVFTLTNSVDRDEMSHYVASHLGLHRLLMYAFRVSSIQRVNEQ